MTLIRHGFTIGIERTGDDFFLSMKATGKLTHQDYQSITPIIDSALAEVSEPKIKALLDITELEGWELRAAWDDFKIGLKHGSEFEKIAIFGTDHWQELATKVAAWFVSGEVKFFDNSWDAIAWLNN